MDLNPEHVIAARLTELERRAFPDVMVWSPLRSVSGCWEAMGEGWDEPIIEAGPVAFADRLAARLAVAPPPV